ncbi:glycosyltransferase family 2 protein [Cetobacterium sp.]|uniref:glycosyltransferase family 2 protein n=1 Tax=Cetobacterium sp. TaxID=2071632 RepID=UPI003F369CA4
MKILSICIPTYNRIDELKKLLDSIEYEINCNKLESKVEICISDNGSTQRIEDMIKEKALNLNIKFNKNLENKGFDFNLEKTTQLATGKYIWFCGDDDEILPNSLNKILSIIKNEEAQIYILDGQVKYNNGIIRKFNALNAKDKKNYNTLKEKEFFEYIDDINNNLSFFCAFITSIIVERELYIKQKIPNSLKNSAYDHMYKLLKAIKNGCKIMYLSDEYYSVGITENDWNKEKGKHFWLDINSLYKFINNLYPESCCEIRQKIGQLLNRGSGKIGMTYNMAYAKKINKKNELLLMMKYFKMHSLKNYLLLIFFSNNLGVEILDKLKKLKKEKRGILQWIR